jgi:hypothetical protein
VEAPVSTKKGASIVSTPPDAIDATARVGEATGALHAMIAPEKSSPY